MSIDLSTLSPKELGSLIATARKRQAQLTKRTPVAQVRTKLTKLAKAEGYTIEELFGGAAVPARGRPSQPASTSHPSLGCCRPAAMRP